MIKAQREARIVELVEQRGVVSIQELADRLGRVSEVSIRRDVARLAQSGRIQRTRGGAVRAAGHRQVTVEPASQVPEQSIVDSVDALILPPISGAGASMLRHRARRRGIPFIAESSPQDGGVYLGPNNFAAGYDLGCIAGEQLGETVDTARILLVALDALPNTRLRCDGFLNGFQDRFAGEVIPWRVEGEGAFRTALRTSMDVLSAHPDINVLFGVNDHSILAAIEASDRLQLKDVSAYSVGGEGGALWDMLARHGRFRATAALFPEVVGAKAIDAVAGALSGRPMPGDIPTAHVIITPESLPRYYGKDGEGWILNDEGVALIGPRVVCSDLRGQRVGFMPHYPAHDWYRNMARAMQLRAAGYGLDLVVAAPSEDIARELRARRQEIARVAARQVNTGDTVLIGGGEACRLLARELARKAGGFTVVTHSFDVLETLVEQPAIKVILTSGEYHAPQRCLVGPSLGALFETIRIDRAFIAVDGISLRFGLSASDERMALAAWRLVQAARSTCVLADHSLVGLDASHRIAPLTAASELITDSGSLPADRVALASAGVRVVVADEETGETEPAPIRSGGGLATHNDR
ncbi:MAG TPA: substrate-binding domain-containing protein [Devosiaceae bacterium]|jgi:DeoR/GlpR family transcriptional regulator of sugar metabolism/ABC-type sugar transport system substrate-binding protein|nr:substrate-binding domain-containing protein [Devosiaceae bacterium]